MWNGRFKIVGWCDDLRVNSGNGGRWSEMRHIKHSDEQGQREKSKKGRARLQLEEQSIQRRWSKGWKFFEERWCIGGAALG